MGGGYAESVYELNRLCRVDDFDKPLSQFVSWCLRQIKPLNWIVVSYSDTDMNHHGYIYQACNFLYTGMSDKRVDPFTPGNKHNRHYTQEDLQSDFKKIRSPKHRYIYFCTSDKKLKREWMNAFKYPICEYPKGDNNPDYVLGTYLEPKIVKR